MRVWVDLTNSPHVLVFRPLIRLLRKRGHEVEVTAREYAQTMQLLELHGIDATVVGRHGGASTLGKARAELSRVPALRRWAMKVLQSEAPQPRLATRAPRRAAGAPLSARVP